MVKINIDNCLTDATNTVVESLSEDSAEEFLKAVSAVKRAVKDAESVEDARTITNAILNTVRQRITDAEKVRPEVERALKENLLLLESLPAGEAQLDAVINLIEQRAFFGKIEAGEAKIRTVGDRASLANAIEGTTHAVFGRLNTMFAKMRVSPFNFQRQDSELAIAVAKEMLGIRTGNEDAVAIATAFRNEITPLLKVIQKAGLPIGEITNYFPRTFDLLKIDRDVEAWLNFMEKALDPTHHADPRATAEASLRKIRNSGFEELEDIKAVMRRELKFRDPKFELEHHQKFGKGSISEALETNLRGLVRTAVMTDTLKSPKPFQTLRALRDRAVANAPDETEAQRNLTRKRRTQIDQRIDELSGASRTPENTNVALFGRILRNFTVMSTLGKTALWNVFVDPVIAGKNIAGIIPGGRLSSGAQAAFRQVNALLETMSSEDAKRILRSYGVSQTIFSGSVADRFTPINVTNAPLGSNTGVLPFMDRLMTSGTRGLMRMTGMASTTEALQRATAYVMVDEMTKLAGRSLKEVRELNPEMFTRLTESGVSADTWAAFARKDHIRNGLLDLDAVDDFGVKTAMSGFMTREVRHSVTSPDLITKRYSRLGLRPGTKAGEAGISSMQFHSFSISFWRNAVARSIQRDKISAGVFAAPLMAGAALKVQLEEWARNESALPWDSTELWLRSFDGSGLGYISGAFAMAGYNAVVDGRDFSVADVLADQTGPVIGRVMQSAELGVQIARDKHKFDTVTDKTLASTTAFGLSLIPYQNALPVYFGFSVLAGKSWTNMIADEIDPLREIRRDIIALEKRL